MNNFFEYDNVTGKVLLNGPDLLLIKEFADLMTPARNKCKEDKSGLECLRAFREFQYIYLALHWQSPFNEFSELERHQEALRDSGLTEEEFNDPTFRAACRKFRSIQEANKSVKLLNAARETVDKMIEYFLTVDPLERDSDSGKPIYRVKDLLAEMKNLIDVHETMVALEAQVKKEIESQSQLRGGFTDGYTPNF